MPDRRMAALAIGVGDARPLHPLPAATNAAHGFHQWAGSNGYDSTLVTDEEEPLTLDRLRQALMQALATSPGDPPIHRLLVFFAGHGFIREAEEGLWLLSDWHKELRAVAVEPLRRRLYQYGIKQIGIIADACRSLSDKLDVADLAADPVLGRGPIPPHTMPEIDRFTAAQDGEKAYALPGDSPEEDRCLFSGVLLEGLWGTNKGALSKLLPTKVTSSSLGTYLKQEVPRVAQRYQLKLNPTVTFSFPEDDNVYFGDRTPLKPAPQFPSWPDPSLFLPGAPSIDLSVNVSGIGRGGGLAPTSEGTDTESIGKQRASKLAEATSSLLTKFNVSLSGRSASSNLAGLTVESTVPVRAIWTSGDRKLSRHSPTGWHYSSPAQVIPTLVEFADDIFAAVTVMPRFIASLIRDNHGVSGLAYSTSDYQESKVGKPVASAFASMASGALRANEARDLAAELRVDKHIDPMLGVISAYLYDAIGDTDSIRRMAYYYTENGQPIPYDIVLLADLACQHNGEDMVARVPEVAARAPSTDAESLHEFTHSHTPSATGLVGGYWPWLRQGWAFLNSPTDYESTLIRPSLATVAQYTTSSRISSFDREGATLLSQLFGLSPTTS